MAVVRASPVAFSTASLRVEQRRKAGARRAGGRAASASRSSGCSTPRTGTEEIG